MKHSIFFLSSMYFILFLSFVFLRVRDALYIYIYMLSLCSCATFFFFSSFLACASIVMYMHA